ncbi:MAG: glycosyltransferase [Candidatus Nezhaarchaeota archaeon]|nr:glycosyltransferase [Candidatus Nezhaarchaeota archaeon]
MPTMKLSISSKLWKWGEISPSMTRLCRELVEKNDCVPYVHEYRSLNSELIMRQLENYPMILQHHGSRPPIPLNMISVNPLGAIKELSKAKRERLLKRVRGAIFVLNKAEKAYLEDVLDVKAMVKIRTMAVDFNELKIPSDDEKMRLRRRSQLPEDAVIVCSYVGVFKEEVGTMKGAHLIAKIWKGLHRRVERPMAMVVTGLPTYWVKELRSLGIKAYSLLPHHKNFLEIIAASDIYFLPATSSYYYGGPGVAIMEALAMGKPAVSPSLIHFPEKDRVKHLGIATPFVDDEGGLKTFIESLSYTVENLSSFKARDIRNLAYKYYSWEGFVRDFEEALRSL